MSPSTLNGLQKGDIVFHYHRYLRTSDGSASGIKSGPHSYVVLHSYTNPLKVYQLAPITSSPSPVANTCVKLEAKNYPDVLQRDSYIDLRFITPVDEVDISPCRINDHPSGDRSLGTIISPTPHLNTVDLKMLDFYLLVTLELTDTVSEAIDQKLREQLTKIVDSIDGNLKDSLYKILDKIENTELQKEVRIEVLEALDNLIREITAAYL